MEVRVEGVGKVLRATGAAKSKDAANIADALGRAAQAIYKRSQTLVPVEFGPLKASGRVEVEGRGFGTRAYVLYGNELAYYAVYVHEDLTKAHASPTCAKFVTKALQQTRGVVSRIVQRSLTITDVRTVPGRE